MAKDSKSGKAGGKSGASSIKVPAGKSGKK